MRSGTCLHCSHKDWNCPYPHCRMSSNRHWNVTRHLQRTHDGVGMPLNKNDFTSKMYKESASREGSLSALAIASSIAAASISSTQKQEKKYDPFDHILQPLRKAAEFKTLFSELSSSSQGIPIPA